LTKLQTLVLLDLSDTAVTKEMVNALRGHLPKCLVVQ
jgi:hypothetical protein